MTASIIKKFVVPPVLISASVFSVLALPLAFLGSKPVTIQLQEEPIFHGQLRDVATPYLGFASVLSLGAGVASVAVAGWRQSSQKSAQVEQQLSGLQQHLKEKEELLEELKCSKSQLETFGLDSFLEDKSVPVIEDTSTSTKQPVSQQIAIETPVQVVEPLIITSDNLHQEESKISPVQASVSRFSSTQAYLAYTQAIPPQKSEFSEENSTTVTSEPDITQVAELQLQLQQIMAQMENLHSTLQTKSQPPVAKPASSNPSMFIVHS